MGIIERSTHYWNGTTLSANGTESVTLQGLGADNIAIQVRSNNSYSVDIEWQDGSGNTIRDETDIFGGGTGGNWNRTNQTAYSAHVKVEVNEDSGGDSTLDGTIHFR